MSRTKNVLQNSGIASIIYVLKMILQFVNRSILIYFVGSYYVGINAVLTNVIGILSLAELGIGASIVYSLYKPIAENDYQKINAYMLLYKKTYRYIALAILMIGLGLLPFLPKFFQESELSLELLFIYLLFLTQSIVPYLLFSYKRSLLLAYQKNYLLSTFDFVVLLIISVLQWGILLLTGNFIFFLVVNIVFILISNILISYVSDYYFPLKQYGASTLSKEDIGTLKKNISGNFIANLAEKVVYGTDSLLISMFSGVTQVAIYSNYTLITSGLMTLSAQALSSNNSIVGNLIHTASRDTVYDYFKKFHYINFVSAYLLSLGVLTSINPIIYLWLGKDYLMDRMVVLFLSIYVFLHVYRQAGFVFYSAYGLFWESRYKPLAEAIINLLLSIIFIRNFNLGILGVLLGTICSTLLTNTWFEPYIIFKYGLKRPIKSYFKTVLAHFILYALSIFAFYQLTVFIPMEPSIFESIAVIVLTLFIVVLVHIVIFSRTEEFRLFVQIFGKLMRKFF